MFFAASNPTSSNLSTFFSRHFLILFFMDVERQTAPGVGKWHAHSDNLPTKHQSFGFFNQEKGLL